MIELDVDKFAQLGALLAHLSYFLLVISMLMSSMLYLRILAIGSGIAGMCYSLFVLGDLVSGFWEFLFILANLGQMALMAWHNRMARFSAEERLFHQSAVPLLAPNELRILLRVSEWRDADAETVLTTQNEPVEDLVFLTRGLVDIQVDDV